MTTLPKPRLTFPQQRTPASADANRENQRRSRARHREFVEDLQRRVREHEAQGVRASVQMQQASRAVAAENAALRALLAQRGVDEGEVSRYLVARLGVADASALVGLPVVMAEPPPTTALTALALAARDAEMALPLPAGESSATSDQSARIEACAPHPRLVCSDRRSGYNPQWMGSSSDTVSSKESTPISTDVTPCDEAAAILVQLRGQPDAVTALDALGCAKTNQCLISNAYLMQLMDQMT
jgi:hypothetical protein